MLVFFPCPLVASIRISFRLPLAGFTRPVETLAHAKLSNPVACNAVGSVWIRRSANKIWRIQFVSCKILAFKICAWRVRTISLYFTCCKPTLPVQEIRGSRKEKSRAHEVKTSPISSSFQSKKKSLDDRAHAASAGHPPRRSRTYHRTAQFRAILTVVWYIVAAGTTLTTAAAAPLVTCTFKHST